MSDESLRVREASLITHHSLLITHYSSPASCRFPLDAPRLINNPFKKPPDRGWIERSGIHLFDMMEHGFFALGNVDRKIEDAFQLSDLDRIFRALVEQLHDHFIDAIDRVAQSHQLGFGIDSVHKQKTSSPFREEVSNLPLLERPSREGRMPPRRYVK